MLFAALVLLLATVGVCWTSAYSAEQRRREMGICVALGADKRRLTRWVLGQGLGLSLIGTLLGLAGALLLSRLVGSLLFEVSTVDPLAFGAPAVLLPLVALGACYLPARRASTMDPITALRAE